MKFLSFSFYFNKKKSFYFELKMLMQFLSKPICHFFAYLYPAYQSYKVIKKDDTILHTQWLTFWIVCTYFTFIEMFGDTLLSWLPLYYEAKIILLIWLAAPQFQGAAKIYDKLLYPYLYHYEKEIDEAIVQMKHQSLQQLNELGKLGLSCIRKKSENLIKIGNQVLNDSTVSFLSSSIQSD